MLFRQFNARKSARSKEDISGAYQCFQPELRACNRSVLMRAAEGVVWFRREVQQYGDKRRHPENPDAVPIGDDVYMIFNQKSLHGFFRMVNEVLKSGKANELKQVPVLAAAYGTYLDDAKQAGDFWRFTAMGNNRNVGDAASDLDAELLRMRDDKEKVSARDRYAKCVKAWHAFNDGIRCTSFKVNTKTKGLPSLGDIAA